MGIIQCHTAQGYYPIIVGCDILRKSLHLSKIFMAKKVLIVSDETVAKFYLPFLQKYFTDNMYSTVIVPMGEPYKIWQSIELIFQALVNEEHDRDSLLVSLGGGVIGDLTGFAASSYMRGIDLVQIPTTLLAQVDAAIGGKTGLHFDGYKNLIGSFYHPKLVVVDLATLATLPERAYRSGLAEIVKYGMACDGFFFSWLEANQVALNARKTNEMVYAIEHSCRLKVQIIARDEYDKGDRIVLNLGHTFAHAIEAATNFCHYFHGEAVSLGLVAASKLAYTMNYISISTLYRVEVLLRDFGLPTKIKGISH